MGKCGEGSVSFIIDGWMLIFYAIIITLIKIRDTRIGKKNQFGWLLKCLDVVELVIGYC